MWSAVCCWRWCLEGKEKLNINNRRENYVLYELWKRAAG